MSQFADHFAQLGFTAGIGGTIIAVLGTPIFEPIEVAGISAALLVAGVLGISLSVWRDSKEMITTGVTADE